jgi:hypothetical protein
MLHTMYFSLKKILYDTFFLLWHKYTQMLPLSDMVVVPGLGESNTLNV